MGFLERIRHLLPFGRPRISREPVTYRAIGVVRNHVREPRTSGWEGVTSDIFLGEELAPALEGIEDFSHVIVLFHMHAIPDEEKRVLTFPLEAENRPEIGLFVTRMPLRPNAIGMSVVSVVRRRKNVLRVRGLDALDGSPVLDIKPYLPKFDAEPGANLPDWALEAMKRSSEGEE